MKNLSFERAEERKHERKRERREDETESRVWGLGFGKNKKNRRDVRRSPSTVLREEHEKLKSRPSSFVQDHEPVLGDRKSSSSFRRSASRFLAVLQTTYHAQPTTVLAAREAELARRSRTGATKWYWPAQADWRFPRSEIPYKNITG